MSADINYSEMGTVLRERSSRKTVSLEHIFAPNGGDCVNYPSTIFLQYAQFPKFGNIEKIASIWRENMLGYLSADIVCSEKPTVFRECSSRKTVSYEDIPQF